MLSEDSEAAADPVEDAAHTAATSSRNDLPEPSDAQRKAGNFNKGHVRVNGMLLSIENPAGTTRSGVADDGTEWSSEMKHHYGYIRGTTGRDKEHIDTFLGPKVGDAKSKVFVVDQLKPDGSFDEHKVMLGFPDKQSAAEAYKSNYGDEWNRLGGVTEMDLGSFKKWAFAPGKRMAALSDLKGEPDQLPGYAAGGSVPSLSQAQLQQIRDYYTANPGASPLVINGTVYQSNYTPNGTGENFDGSYSGGDEIYSYQLGQQDPGQSFSVYDSATGNQTDTRQFREDRWLQNLLVPLVASLGMYYGLGGVGAGATDAGSAAGFAGDTTAWGYGGAPDAFGASSATSLGGGATVNGGAALSSGAGFAGAIPGANINPAFDTLGDITNANIVNSPFSPPTVQAPLPMDGSYFSSLGTTTGIGPVNGFFPSSPFAPDLTFPSSGTGGTGGGGLGGLSPTTLANLIRTAGTVAGAVGGAGGGSGGGSGGGGSGGGGNTPQTPFDPGNPWYMPPGWRTDRPMYVPGQDEIPVGWLGAGGAT